MTYTVYAVAYSNYFPLEIEELYTTEEAAREAAKRLNADSLCNGSMWTVAPMEVHDEVQA